jgi:hypothetical protein
MNMPTFEITTPEGKAYHVEGANAEGALAAVQQMLSPSPAAGSSVLSPRPMGDVNPFEEYRQKPANPSDLPPGFVGGPAADYSKMSDADLLRVVGPNPIRVTAPDGSVVHFPEGTSDATMNAAMRKAYDAEQFGPKGTAQGKTTLNIEGRKVSVDDSFLLISPQIIRHRFVDMSNRA